MLTIKIIHTVFLSLAALITSILFVMSFLDKRSEGTIIVFIFSLNATALFITTIALMWLYY